MIVLDKSTEEFEMTDQTELERLKAEMDATRKAAWAASRVAYAAETAYTAAKAKAATEAEEAGELDFEWEPAAEWVAARDAAIVADAMAWAAKRSANPNLVQ